MSGITGWVARERDLTTQADVLEAMTATLTSRGPDGTGSWLQPDVALGHCRAGVLAGGAGQQPLVADVPGGQAVAVVYDGQIYNAAGIRQELRRRGHPFRTEGDAEVLLRGYLEWGGNLAHRLSGMYAFAIWDGRVRALVMGRDRMGLRPLHFYPLDDGLLFGSEPKAILAHPRAQRVVDAEGLCEIFSGFNRTPGHAIWSGMREVRPGTLVTAARDGMTERTYWQLTAEPHHDDQATTVATARELLTDSVASQIRSDAPCGILLSGGLDSSILAGLASRHLRDQRHGHGIATFTMDFANQGRYEDMDLAIPPVRGTSPDPPYARDMAAALGSSHRDIILGHAEVADPRVRRACVEARDFPTGLGDRDLSFYLLCLAVRESAAMVLSGDAGGQAFTSPRVIAAAPLSPSAQPRPERKPLDDTALLSARFLEAIGRDRHLREHRALLAARAPVLEGEQEARRKERILSYQLMIRMPLGVTSERRDRIGMAAGLEVRAPYYDHHLVQYLYNVPGDMKVAGGKPKSIMRSIGADLLPKSVLERGRKGYPAILDVGYVAAIQRQVRDVVNAHHDVLEFYDADRVSYAVKEEPAMVTLEQRSGMERLLDFAIWLDERKPSIKLPGA